MFRLDQKIYKKSNFVSRRIDNEYIIVPISDNVGDMKNVINLNEVASFIWQNIDGKKTIENLVDGVITHFEVDKETAQNDVIEFIGRINNLLINIK